MVITEHESGDAFRHVVLGKSGSHGEERDGMGNGREREGQG